MSKTIKIQILHQLAMKSAKDETYQKAIVEKAVNQDLVVAAFHEQAGNEAYHESMLKRSMFTQIEQLKTMFFDYLTGGGNISEDATISDEEKNNATEIVLHVSDRFNDGYVKSLARLGQKWVEDRMIHLWWLPVSKEFADIYASAADDDMAGITRCFQKTAPAAPVYKFPTAITLSYPVIPERDGCPGVLTPGVEMEELQLYHNPWRLSRGQETEISYTLSGENENNPIDDILVVSDSDCCKACLTRDGGWMIRGMRVGCGIVKLFSRHNHNVFAKFAVVVTN